MVYVFRKFGFHLFCAWLCATMRPSFSMECFVGSQAIINEVYVNKSSSSSIIEVSLIQTETQLEVEKCPSETCACCSYFYNVSESQYCVSWSADNKQGCDLQTPKINEPVYKLSTSSCDTPLCNKCFGLQSPARGKAVSIIFTAFYSLVLCTSHSFGLSRLF